MFLKYWKKEMREPEGGSNESPGRIYRNNKNRIFGPFFQSKESKVGVTFSKEFCSILKCMEEEAKEEESQKIFSNFFSLGSLKFKTLYQF